MQMSDWESELRDIMPHVIAFRRELHRHPELSGQEIQTKQRILREFRALGIETAEFTDCHAVMGVLRNGEGRCIAVRADMDALPIREETGLSYASENPGVMHACGHDIHMAMSLGSALWFSRNRDRWQGTVKWFFEPAEETFGGGQWMVAQGCMEHPTVDCILGQHVNPRYATGTFFCKSGFVSGSSDELALTVRGQSCHGAYPESGVDAIVIAAQVISALQTLISRSISPFEPAVLTLGKIHGGTAENIVCGEVVMRGTLRTLSDQTRGKLRQRMVSVAAMVAEGLGGSCDVVIRPSNSAVYNDDHDYAIVERNARELLGDDHIVIREAPSLGVESFSHFLKHTPGVYYDIGSGISTALHTPTILFDEDVIQTGVALQCANVLSLLKSEDRS